MPRQEEQLRWWAATSPDEVAYLDVLADAELTFGGWDRGANQMARALLDAGVRPGDRVALHVEPSRPLEWLISYPAIHRADAVAVPTNTRLTARELDTVLGHADPTVVITSTGLADLHHDRPGVQVIVVDDPSTELPDDGDPLDTRAGGDDLADIMYTSGTTGLPKGIAVRHRQTAMIPNGEPPWTGTAWIHSSPMFTFAGLSFVYNPMKLGMRGMYLSRFDVDRWIDAVEIRRPTCAFLVPAMAQLLLSTPRFETADLSSLELVSIGSAPLPPSLHLRLAAPARRLGVEQLLHDRGRHVVHVPPEGGAGARRRGSVGIPMGTRIRIVDDDGQVAGPNVIGEVEIEVGASHREYYRNPDAYRGDVVGGWLRSGDLGELDEDGYLYIRGRKRDMIIRGGHNVMATDVEAVLYEHAGVLEAAVVPVPHPVLGEDVGAAVVAQPGATLDIDELVAFCRDRLSDYKVPRRIWFLDELPRNPTGKVLKRELVVPDSA